MYPFRRAMLGTITLNPATDAGQRKFLQLEQNSFVFGLYFVIAVTLVIATNPATEIRNRGSAAAAFDFVGLNENGFDRVLLDPRVGAFIGQMRAMSSLSSTRLASVATTAGVTLKETIPVFFANPNSLNPGETAFRERNPSAFTQAFVQLSATGAANIAKAGGGGTCTISAATVDVYELHNPNQKTLPWFVPFISQTVMPITATNGQQRIPIMSDRYLSGLVISQDAGTEGEVTDICLSLRVLSDVRTYIGPNMLPWEDAQRFAELQFGGAVFAPPSGTNVVGNGATVGSHLPIDFMHHGQLSTMVEPNETNLRIEASVQQTAQAGATSSLLRITTIEMVRDLSKYVAPGGGTRMVCNPETLPWLDVAA